MATDDITSPASSGKQSTAKQVGRNEPCPCGSGVKYKRCHGVEAPPVLSERKVPQLPQDFGASPMGNPMGGMAPGGAFDPSQMDPAMLMQMSQMLQRLPKGQMQKLQTLMQKAMTGKDISREAQDFERLLPPDFVEAMKGFAVPGMSEPGTAPAIGISAETTAAETSSLSADEARAIVEQAVKEGKVSADQVADLLPGDSKKPSFWSRFTGKK